MVQRFMGSVAVFFEIAGALAMAVGFLAAFGEALVDRVRGRRAAFRDFQLRLGSAIVIGLELLVAADIVISVAIEPDFRHVAVLGVIVLIRTVISVTLAVELHGRWPWQGHAGDH